jgi:hypothetical protein
VARAAQEPDSLRRLALTAAHNLSQFNICKHRCKKPFNPHLGETYELVTEHCRFIAEQVSHHPPISAYYQEGQDYSLNGSLQSKASFGFGGGTGSMVVRTPGVQDYIFSKFDNETITASRPLIYVKNLITTRYLDIGESMNLINHRTGERAEIRFTPKGWYTDSQIDGTIYDAAGTEKYTLAGSWKTAISLTNIETEEEELLWQEPVQPEDSEEQFGFNQCAIQCNYIDDEMRVMLPPSDTRLRGDQRLFEEGKVDEADEEKVRLEVKQRQTRKARADAGEEWVSAFFKHEDHRLIEGETMWHYKPENCYWKKRASGNWKGQPDLW